MQTLGVALASNDANGEAITQLEASLRLADEVGDTATSYRSCRDLAELHVKLGNQDKALSWYRRAHSIARALGDPRREADALVAFAVAAEADDEVELALAYWRRAAAALREGGDDAGLASVLCSMGSALATLNSLDAASSCYEESAGIARDLSDRRQEAAALHGLTRTLRGLGHVADAAAVDRRIIELDVNNMTGTADLTKER